MEKKLKAQELSKIMEKALNKIGAPKIMNASLRETIEFRHLLNDETDRGCALMAAAYLEVSLEKLLKKCVVQDNKAMEAAFSNGGFLGTFSSKIELAFLLGFITRRIKRDLDLLRKIRNDFAHNPAQLKFESQAIKSRCIEFSADSIAEDDGPRFRFTRTMMRIDGEIYAASSEIEAIKERKEIDAELQKRLANIFHKVVADSGNS